MPIHRLLALSACLFCAGAAQAEVIAHPQSVVRPFNNPTDFTLSATDDTPGGPYPISWAIASPPAHGQLNVIIGNGVRYYPHDNYVGEDSFTFTATTENGTSAPATLHITMEGPVPPIAFNGHYDVKFNLPADIGLRGGNPNWGSSLNVTYLLVDPPAHGEVTGFGGAGNYVIYTPNLDYRGADSFTFRVWHEEWGYSSVATASITVAEPAPPVAYPGRQYAPHATPTAIVLKGKDPNPAGTYPLTFAVATPPPHGSVTISGDTATYTPDDGFWGEDSFAFTANSVNGTSEPVAVRVLVGQRVTLGLPGGRNDSGQLTCTDSAGSAIDCTAITAHTGQDGRIGRDAQAGAAAFDFEAIGGGCVRDRVTGLVWSAETLAARSWAAAAASATGYDRCGMGGDWRLPTRRELLSIAHHGASHPAIDATAFPATQSAPYWSGDTQGANAWAVDFSDGATRSIAQAESHAARLVVRPVNQAPTITLGAAEIVLRNDEMPKPQVFPGWASGIGAGPASESGQQLITTVRLFPVPLPPEPDDEEEAAPKFHKMLAFDVPPAIDPATGDLTFTVHHRIYPDRVVDEEQWYYWASAAGRVRVEVTLQDDGGTEGGGADTTVKSFEIFLTPVPRTYDVNIKHPWKPVCIPVTMHATDIDTDPRTLVVYPLRYRPMLVIKTHPSQGFLTDYVSSARSASAAVSAAAPLSTPVATLSADASPTITSGISVPLGDDEFSVPGSWGGGMHNSMMSVPGPITPRGFFSSTICYVPFSSTFVGSDTFSYSVVDVDGNESNVSSVSIEIFEIK